ncbi:uncharacterized protein LOC130555919 isoform X1 [Triplophysa rosa]|uniref:uncharacterized protein LOC130555919 isoform X1 n=2 Tax=Triplophysa rosa TaxID=992332 RepID=UPI00254620A6|nr:uncharacterized protein LOC130555919 isoform X1 [Triplophysa rosa]
MTLQVWNMLFIKVRYQGSRKFIKLQDGFTFADFINEVHSRFGLPARTDLCIFDDTDTEIDEDILQDVLKARPDMLLTARGQNEEFLSSYATSSPCTDTLSQSRSHSSTELDDQTPERPSKNSKPSDDSAAEAKKVVLCALEKNSGGDAILAEYSSKKTLSSEMRQLLVNILVAHMVQMHGRIPTRNQREQYALGVVSLLPSLRDPFSKKKAMSIFMIQTVGLDILLGG